jgi:hypothetical protein
MRFGKVAFSVHGLPIVFQRSKMAKVELSNREVIVFSF